MAMGREEDAHQVLSQGKTLLLHELWYHKASMADRKCRFAPDLRTDHPNLQEFLKDFLSFLRVH